MVVKQEAEASQGRGGGRAEDKASREAGGRSNNKSNQVIKATAPRVEVRCAT